MYNGFHISKEIARQFYKKTRWYVDVEGAKRDAEQKNVTDWKSLCKTQPPKLDKKLLTIISKMYMATTNAITKQKFFDVDSLPKIIEYYNEYLVEKK